VGFLRLGVPFRYADYTTILTMPIVTATARDHERLMEALARISSMDASIVVRNDADSDEVLVSGTSSEHLQSIFRKIADDHS
jgi:translation elongation factor EF-G